jgi:Epoxide hydrolase N terminus
MALTTNSSGQLSAASCLSAALAPVRALVLAREQTRDPTGATGARDGQASYRQRPSEAHVSVTTETPAGATEIRPFHVDVPDEALDDLRRRIAATRWPEKETVADDTQGVQLATMEELVRYWGTEYDFRRFEARLNALPQFITEIDGLDIHFIHVKSPHENALPLIITHGWPGSVIEMLNVIGPLTDPPAHGGDAEDAFDVVVPSIPGTASRRSPRPPAGTRSTSRGPGSR